MEASYFNVAAENDQGEHILFNTLRGSLAVLDDDAYADYAALSGDSLDALYAAGFVVDDAQDEVALQRAWFERDKANRDVLSLCIAPTYRCNLSCTYCYEKEQHIPGSMGEGVAAGILRFVEDVFRRHPFKRFFVTWYGGEPVLCLDTIEELSGSFMAFCAQHGVSYGAEIITNATLIDEDAAARLVRCRVAQAMPSFAGCAELHDKRRVDASGKSSFEQTRRGIENLHEAGASVAVSVNMDKRTLSDYRALRDWADGKDGISIFPTMLRDYLADTGKGGFEEGAFDLFTREEFSRAVYGLHKEGAYDAGTIRGLFAPIRNFCRGQLENYFVIDVRGDVYKCDGRMGYREHALFNVADGIDAAPPVTASYNPMDDPLCRECPLLPLCKGNCTWDRALLGCGCHPLKYTIGAYIADYRGFFGEATAPVTVLVEPVDLDSLFAQDALGDGLTPSVFPDEAKGPAPAATA